MAPMEGNPTCTANAPNIAPDKKMGIGCWTDIEIVLANRECKRPDGSIIGPQCRLLGIGELRTRI